MRVIATKKFIHKRLLLPENSQVAVCIVAVEWRSERCCLAIDNASKQANEREPVSRQAVCDMCVEILV